MSLQVLTKAHIRVQGLSSVSVFLIGQSVTYTHTWVFSFPSYRHRE